MSLLEIHHYRRVWWVGVGTAEQMYKQTCGTGRQLNADSVKLSEPLLRISRQQSTRLGCFSVVQRVLCVSVLWDVVWRNNNRLRQEKRFCEQRFIFSAGASDMIASSAHLCKIAYVTVICFISLLAVWLCAHRIRWYLAESICHRNGLQNMQEITAVESAVIMRLQPCCLCKRVCENGA